MMLHKWNPMYGVFISIPSEPIFPPEPRICASKLPFCASIPEFRLSLVCPPIKLPALAETSKAFASRNGPNPSPFTAWALTCSILGLSLPWGLGSRSQFSYPLLMLQIRYCRWSVAPVGQPCYKLDGRKEGWFLRKRDEELSSGKWASQMVQILCDGVILPAGVLEDQSVSSDRSRTGVKFVTDYLLLWWIREHIINLSSDEQGWVYALARTGVSYAPQCYAVGWEQ